MRFSVVHDAEVIDQEFGAYSPFCLKRDIKYISNTELTSIAKDIENEIYRGPHGNVYTVLYKSKLAPRINFSKIKVADVSRKKGKSSGYRAIVLIDENIHYAFLLHLYRHGHGEDKNISTRDCNALKSLTDEYAKQASE